MRSKTVYCLLCLKLIIIFDGYLLCSCQKNYTPEQKKWVLATTALVFEVNKERHDILAGVEAIPKNIDADKKALNEWWGINSREDLLNSLMWIEESGHRKSFEEMAHYISSINEKQFKEMIEKMDISKRNKWETVSRYWFSVGKKSLIGWDYCRYIALCRWGYLAGYLSEKETWVKIIPIARMLQKTFDSWSDLGDNYIIGRTFWSYEQMEGNKYLYYKAYNKLIQDADSPWKKIPWNLKL